MSGISAINVRGVRVVAMPDGKLALVEGKGRDDFRRLSERNIEGYLYITRLAVKQMLLPTVGDESKFLGRGKELNIEQGHTRMLRQRRNT